MFSWEFIKEDVMSTVNDFATRGVWPRGSNASFLCLIPKNDNPQQLNDFRPISLVGCMYKIMSKALSLRLKRVIDKVIDVRKSAFLEGQSLLDGVLVANDALEEMKRKKRSCVFLKVDYEKAYDFIVCEFIYYMLGEVGFCDRWINWIKSCLEFALVSVLVNGSPTKEFIPKKGLRQGDPLTPFLFLIATEGPTGVSRMADEKQLIDNLKIGDKKVNVNMQMILCFL